MPPNATGAYVALFLGRVADQEEYQQRWGFWKET